MSCPVDGRDLAGRNRLCVGCATKLVQALAETDALMDDLDTTLTRQTKRRPARGNHPRDDTPLPYDIGASKAGTHYRDLLKDWASLVAEGLGREGTFVYPPMPATAKTLAAFLLTHAAWLIRQDTAPDAYSEILGAVNNIRRTIDIAPDTQFIGPCYSVIDGVECTETLYAVAGKPEARCRTCGTVWDARERTLEALAHATRIAQDPTTLSRSFTLRGIALDTERIKQWAKRGHLTRAGTSHRNHPTYIVAHVARLITLYETGTKLTNWDTEQEPAQ